MSPTSGQRPAWVSDTLYPFRSHFADIAGNIVHHLDEGAGPMLLFLHGNPTWSFLYRHQIRDLRARFRCVAIDYPGFGLSTAAPGYRYRPADHAGIVAELVDRLDLRDVTLVAGDWGGPIGLAVAARRPGTVTGAVFTNTWAWPTTGRRRLLSAVAGGWPGRRLIRRTNLFARLAVPIGHRRTRLDQSELAHYRQPFLSPTRRYATALFARHLTASSGFLDHVEAVLPELRVLPVRIVWGERDPAFGPRDRRRLEHAFPRYATTRLTDAGHFVPDDAPEALTDAIRSWHPIRHRAT